MFVAISLAVAVALSACAAGGTAKPTPTTTALVKPSYLPAPPSADCEDGVTKAPPSSTLWIGADGAWFHAGLVGPDTDTTVAVLVHQSNLGYCGWWKYAAYLSEHGVRTVLLNLCGYGATVCPDDEPLMASGAQAVLAAAQWARAHGATRVVTLGASMGGTAVVLAASEDKGHALDAVADLSGPIVYEDAVTTGAGSTITIASFFAVDPNDEVVGGGQLEGLASEIKGPTPILHLDGSGHGWDLLTVLNQFNPLAAQLADFIQGTPATN